MATDLKKLAVSLTKHGAHKLASLLTKYDKDSILDNLSGSEPGINIELAQAKKNLSVNRSGQVPDVWDDARQRGQDTVDALILIAIIFSHYRLIDAFQKASNKGHFTGTINREQFHDEKEFTNLADSLKVLGYSRTRKLNSFSYDFQKIFQIPELHTLSGRLLTLKLATAKWDQRNSLPDEATKLGFHEVFSITADELRSWLTTGSLTQRRKLTPTTSVEQEDLDFFSTSNEDIPPGKFDFQPGHNPKKTGTVTGTGNAGMHTATLLHNEIQNKLYEQLANKYGENCVGTENSTGDGTSIDLVVKTQKFCWFYEIKTASSVKACIRQAIPQLLEYAYWHGAMDRADKLIVVGTKKITTQASAYLEFLRKQFGLAIFYEQFKED